MGSTFLRRLRAGEAQIGMWLSTGSITVADMLRDIGYDWCLIDMEHTPNEVADVQSQLLAQSAGPAETLVRPYWNDTVLVKRLLDAGATGFIFPMIQSAEEAAAAVAATRYPPEGVRGVALSHPSSRFGRRKDYFEAVHDEICVIVQIESREALDRVAEIASVPGVDGVFFGPADIGASLGHLGDLDHPEVWDAIYKAADVLKDLGVPAGTMAGKTARIREALERGFQFVACGTDLSIMEAALRAQVAEIRG